MSKSFGWLGHKSGIYNGQHFVVTEANNINTNSPKTTRIHRRRLRRMRRSSWHSVMSMMFLAFADTSTMNQSAAKMLQQQGIPQCHKHSLWVPLEAQSSRRSSTLTIAHRGASYHLPEHTLESYRLALELGADFIEPDIVVSSDGILFAMHSIDLNITTNVVEVFGATQPPWFSSTMNRSGYWSYNFTWEQIQSLRVKQRLPTSRSTMYDNLFRVPSLSQIVQTLRHWNTIDLPATMNLNLTAASEPINASSRTTQHPSPHQQHESGLYLELKTVEWILQESGWDLVKLLYEQIWYAFELETTTATGISKTPEEDVGTGAMTPEDALAWKHLLPCFESVRFDEYIVPGLVLQSFNATDLRRFHDMWHTSNITTPTAGDTTTTGSTSSRMIDLAAEPPYVLLTEKPSCWKDSFWFEVGENYRSFLSGIGCDKNCLLWNTNQSTSEVELERQQSTLVSEKAKEFNLVLHVWTERPETQYLASSQFNSSLDEMHHLICNVPGVHGIFSESVDQMIRAVHTPCTDATTPTPPPNATTANNSTATIPYSTDGNVCYESPTKLNVSLGLATFVAGCLVSFVMSIGCTRCKGLCCRRRGRRQPYSVATNDDEGIDDLELTVT